MSGLGAETPSVGVAQRRVLEAVADLRGNGPLPYLVREEFADALAEQADKLRQHGVGHDAHLVALLGQKSAVLVALGRLIQAIADDLNDVEDVAE